METLFKVVTLQHPRHCLTRSQTDHAFGTHLAQPAGVKFDTSLGGVQNFEHLLFIGLGVSHDLLFGQWRTGGIFT